VHAWALVFTCAIAFKQLVLDPIVFLSRAPPGRSRDAAPAGVDVDEPGAVMMTTPFGARSYSVDEIAEATPLEWGAASDDDEFDDETDIEIRGGSINDDYY
jgi:hypothetical protein